MRGDIVAENRKRVGLSQLELAQRLGVTQPMIAQVERGTKGLSLELAKRMASVFGITVDELAGGQ